MEKKIVDHYRLSGNGSGEESGNSLKNRIVAGLTVAGKNFESLKIKDLSVIDQLHTGGHLATLEIIKKSNLQPGIRILDAGCGIGGSSRLLAQEFQFRVTGVDIVDEFISTAEYLTDSVFRDPDEKERIEFKQGSILEIPFPGSLYDAVMSQHTLMNIQDKNSVFKEFNRVLKPGGLLLLHEVIQRSENPIDLPVPWAASHDISFLNDWDTLLESLNTNGFELVHYSDKFEQAKKWWAKVKEVTGKPSDVSRPLGPHIVFGENGKHFGANMLSNIETKRISVAEAVLKKI